MYANGSHRSCKKRLWIAKKHRFHNQSRLTRPENFGLLETGSSAVAGTQFGLALFSEISRFERIGMTHEEAAARRCFTVARRSTVKCRFELPLAGAAIALWFGSRLSGVVAGKLWNRS